MPAWLGPAISAGANLLGGLIGGSDKGDVHDQWRHEKNMIDYQAGIQREFARNGIKWRVRDAREAGIHPLYALGAPTTSFSPISVGGSSYSGGSSLGAGLAAAGADIGRAVSATSSASERALADRRQQLGLRNMELQNELLESQVNGSRIANLRQAGGNPPQPSVWQRWLMDGQGQTQTPSGLVSVNPMPVTATEAGRPWSDPGAVPDVGYARTRNGWAPVPSADAKQRIEDTLLPDIAWSFRNNFLPSLGFNYSPPNVPLKKGYRWEYNPLSQEYFQAPDFLY